VAASAIATLDTLSGGRAMLGIGRGDSALANLGAAPASIPEFDLYLGALQSYLSGEGVPFALSQRWLGPTRPVSEIPLGEAHDDSRLSWRQPGERTVPVDVVATGPRMIALGAQRSTRVTLAVGADLDRLRWAREVARQGRLEAGLDPDDLSLGVALSVVALDDVAAARARCAPSVASQARFSTMHGKPIGPVSDADRQVLEAVSAAYDMRFHGGPGAQIRALTDDFIDRFAVVGPPGRCVERLQEIAALGFDRVTVYLSGDALEPDDDKAYQALVESVIPHV
jgi:5,10-methylenetetrahydromethanopterin reductase